MGWIFSTTPSLPTTSTCAQLRNSHRNGLKSPYTAAVMLDSRNDQKHSGRKYGIRARHTSEPRDTGEVAYSKGRSGPLRTRGPGMVYDALFTPGNGLPRIENGFYWNNSRK